jgi:hypothetical protein
MPGDAAAVTCRLREKLVAPETNRPADKLQGRNKESGIPEEVVRRELAYANAVRERYRFYSYGGCMLIV